MVKRAKTRLPAPDYVAALIHDMKNLLGATAGNIAFAREQLGEARDDCGEALEDADDALRRIGALADELLTVSQYEAGTLFVSAEPLRVREVLDAVARNMDREVSMRETSVAVLSPDELDCTADRGLVSQALESMIGWFVRQASRGAAVELHALETDTEIELVVVRRLTSPLDEIPRALYVAECIAMAHGGALDASDRGGAAAVVLRLPKVYSTGTRLPVIR